MTAAANVLGAGALPLDLLEQHLGILALADLLPAVRVDGNLTGGFALIAWPAEYGESGVMSFMLSRQGIVYEADLGPDSASFASAVQAFDPDARWQPVARMFADSQP